MPVTFPSHQGLLAPLWRRWPGRFGVLGLWVGALAPDLVDGAWGLATRGRFGQGIGHSLAGLMITVPAGLVALAALRRAIVAARWSMRAVGRAARWLAAVDADVREGSGAGPVRDLAAVLIGAVSHLAFDLISHERSLLLFPFAHDPDWFGAWWHTEWFRIDAPFYDPYPVGPHFVSWCVLSVVGAVMFVCWPPMVTRDQDQGE